MTFVGRAVRFQVDRIFTSCLLFTIALLSLVPNDLRLAATLPTRHVWETDRIARQNYESDLAFSSLALVIICLVVIWTSYRKKSQWSWFAMAVFTSVYFVPVHLIDVFLDIKRVGWAWWPGVVRDAMDGRPFAAFAIRFLITLAVLIAALLVPIGEFFGKGRSPTGSAKPN